jgi:hypothetical protein
MVQLGHAPFVKSGERPCNSPIVHHRIKPHTDFSMSHFTPKLIHPSYSRQRIFSIAHRVAGERGDEDANYDVVRV